MTAMRPPPPVRASSMMVRVLFTKTLPRSREQRRKLPSFRTGRIALASSCSCSDPVLITICSSVWSSAIRPRLRPEKRPERQRRKARKMKLTQVGQRGAARIWIETAAPRPCLNGVLRNRIITTLHFGSCE